MNGPISTLLATPTDRMLIETSTTNQRACPACQTDMELHQPDATTPARLLGVCPCCRAWTLVKFVGRDRYKLTLLAESEQ